MQTPYFPTFRCRFAAQTRRAFQHLRQASLSQVEQCLETYLPAHWLAAEEQGPNSRERIYSLRLTFQCFLWQLLTPQTACREVVRQVQALFRLKGLGPVHEGTSAYCQARSRLPRRRLEAALAHLAQGAEQRAGEGGRLGGRPVKVVDSTTVRLPDTRPNQHRYPQSPHQQPGCGFPLLKLLALFSLSSGAIETVTMDDRRHHDLRLFRRLWDRLRPGDIVLGDRLLGEYAALASLPPQGVDVVARLTSHRKLNFRKAHRLGRHDGWFVWTKAKPCPPYLTQIQWTETPAAITVRVLRFRVTRPGCRSRSITLVTTLLDHQRYRREDLAALYARRWRLELCFRNLKSQMGMDSLRCQTPPMAEKEVLTYLVAHNLVRCLMAEVVARYQVELERISFQGTVAALRQYTEALAQARSRQTRRELWEDLWRNLARDLVPLRPGRREPRAIKQRPKQYPVLNRPRRWFKDPIPFRKWRRTHKPGLI